MAHYVHTFRRLLDEVAVTGKAVAADGERLGVIVLAKFLVFHKAEGGHMRVILGVAARAVLDGEQIFDLCHLLWQRDLMNGYTLASGFHQQSPFREHMT
jgi:hypothetical protein